jgi:putative hydrolase of the HAD superfamily
VIFDLFGTLIDDYSVDKYDAVIADMAAIFSVPKQDFLRVWLEPGSRRMTGESGSLYADIEYVCRKLSIPPEKEKIERAARARVDFTRNSMAPRPGALEVLAALKSRGYKTALITNCSSEVPLIWKETAFAPFMDIAVFSSVVHMKKPDRRIYLIATGQLAVRPDECLFVGDGTSDELNGAAAAGMHPIQIRVPQKDSGENPPANPAVEKWTGPVISSLMEILDFVGED